MSQPHPPLDAADTDAAERWFLGRGLPAVLRRGALLRRVAVRSAPALAALAVVAANSVLIVAISGKHTVDIAGRPDFVEGVVLGLLALVLPLAAAVGWLVSRVSADSRRRSIAVAALVVTGLGALVGGFSNRVLVNVLLYGIAAAVIVVGTVTGIGSILGWALRLTTTNLRHLAGMAARALPVLLLTFLVFFNGSVWVMAATIGRPRLWLGMGFLFLVAASFLVSGALEQVRPLLAESDRLSRAERANVLFVVTASQITQVISVAAVTGLMFLVLGLILISPPLLEAWTRGGRSDGEVLGMTLPIPDALIQTTLFLSAITFMYLAAKAVTDTAYRTKLLDPMLDDVRVTLAARERYRAAAG